MFTTVPAGTDNRRERGPVEGVLARRNARSSPRIHSNAYVATAFTHQPIVRSTRFDQATEQWGPTVRYQHPS
ncbi:hypothetical protein GCM10027074_75710 [Streptomyces deserti]